MIDHLLPDPASQFGQRVRRRLREDWVIWLTTVGRDGTPQPNPVWFLWDDRGFLVYNQADAHRLQHVRRRARVSLHFDSNGRGGDVVVLSGRAELLDGQPPPHALPEYLAKYREGMVEISGSPEAFSAQYPVALRIQPIRVRGY